MLSYQLDAEPLEQKNTTKSHVCNTSNKYSTCIWNPIHITIHHSIYTQARKWKRSPYLSGTEKRRTVKAEMQRLWGFMWRQGAWEEYHDILFNLQISHPLLCTTVKASRTKNMHSRRLTSGRCTVVHLAPVNLSSHGSHFLQPVLNLCSTRSMASQRVYNKTIS